MTIDGRFTRASLPEGAPPPAWLSISHRWVERKEDRRKLHGKWCRITSPYTSRAGIYRALRFGPTLAFDDARESGEVAIDWAGWLDLQGRDGLEQGELGLKIEVVGGLTVFLASWLHPDPSYRIASQISLVSFALGILALVLAVWESVR